MILSNLLLAVGMVGATAVMPYDPPQTQPHNAVTTTEYEYEYETNEVNSFDDLIIGNIYHIENQNEEGDSFFYDSAQSNPPDIEYRNLIMNIREVSDVDDLYLNDESIHILQYGWNPQTHNIWVNTQDTIAEYNNAYWILALNYSDISLEGLDIIMTETFKTFYINFLNSWSGVDYVQQYFDNCNFIHKSNYLGELIPVETTTNGLYNTIEEFIEEYLFNNDKLKETEYTIMGTTYNMAEWLAHTTTMVMMILILGILLYFVKWCFKQISNTFTLIGAN